MPVFQDSHFAFHSLAPLVHMHPETQIKSPRREHTILHRKPWKVLEFYHGGQAERLAGPAPEVPPARVLTNPLHLSAMLLPPH